MKKIILGIFILTLFVFLGAYGLLQIYGSNMIKKQIQVQLSKSLNADVQIENLTANWFLPFAVSIKNTTIKQNFYQIAIPDATIRISLKTLFTSQFEPSVQLDVVKPTIEIKIGDEKASVSGVNGKTQTELAVPIKDLTDLRSISQGRLKNLQIQLNIRQMQVVVFKANQKLVQEERLNLNIKMDSLGAPIFIQSSGSITYNNQWTPFSIPWSVESEILWKEWQLQITNSKIAVLNLETKMGGQIDTRSRKLAANVSAKISDLSKIQVPTKDLPLKSWSGDLEVRAKLDGSIDQLMVNGIINLKNARLGLDFANENLRAQGQVAISSEVQFYKGLQDGTVAFPKLMWLVDLTGLQVEKKDIFQKETGQPLVLNGNASFLKKVLNLEIAELKFRQLKLEAKGSYSAEGSSQIQMQIFPTELSGFEKNFLPLKKYPMKGQVELKANIAGLLTDPQKMKLSVPTVKIQGLQTYVDFKNQDMQVSGPVSLSAMGNLVIDQMNVQNADISVNSDLSPLRLVYKNQYQKPENEILKFNLQGIKQGSKLAIRRGSLQGVFGALEFSGEPPLSLTSPFSINIKSEKIDLSLLKKNLPEYQKLIPAGAVSFQGKLQGRMNPDAFMESPIDTIADIKIDLPSYKMEEMAQVAEKAAAAVPVKAPEAFLKSTEILKRANISGQANINKFEKGNLLVQGIKSKFMLKKANLSAQAQIQNVFSGAVKINSFSLPLTEANPLMSYDIETDKTKIEDVLGWMYPQFAKLASGQSNFAVQGKSYLPSSSQFMDHLESQGKFNLINGTLHTVQLGEMLKGILEKIPGGKADQIANRGSLQVTGQGKFLMKNGAIQIRSFDVKTNRNERLDLAGQLNLKMDVDMAGNIHLVDKLGGGSFFEANKDTEGRLTIPLKIQGNALSPEFKFAQETISKMIEKTVNYEKNKAIQSAKQQAKAQVNKVVEQGKTEVKNKLEEELKKRIKF